MGLNRARTVEGGRFGARGGRGRLPAVLLTDVVLVEPYQSTATWGPQTPLRCLVDEVPSTALTGQGTIIGKSLRIFAPLGSDVPEGSKITLADGRTGFAAAVAQRAPTAAFPVPSHLEIVMRVGSIAPSPIGARTVIIWRRVLLTERDEYGNDRYGETSVQVPGAVVGQVESDSNTSDPGNERITRRRTVVLPAGTDIGALDRLEIDGERWGIDGAPQQVTEPTLGVTAGIVVRLVRVSG